MFGIVLTCIAIYLVLFFVIAVITRARAKTQFKKQYIKETKERVSDMDSTMTYVTYRGFNIPMTVLEKRTMWDAMTRDMRNKALADFKQALKDERIKEYKP